MQRVFLALCVSSY